MEDSRILELFNARDESAIEEAAHRHGGLCRALALRVLGDVRDAEECVSDALLAAWDSIPPARPEKLAAYLAKLTRNLALKRRRDQSRLKRGGAQYDLAYEKLAEHGVFLLQKPISRPVFGFLKEHHGPLSMSCAPYSRWASL